jgi:hypothetical protein
VDGRPPVFGKVGGAADGGAKDAQHRGDGPVQTTRTTRINRQAQQFGYHLLLKLRTLRGVQRPSGLGYRRKSVRRVDSLRRFAERASAN